MNISEGKEVNAMRKFKRGDYAVITKPVILRRKGGKIEHFRGQTVKVVGVDLRNCRCDIGIGKLVNIPMSHLQRVA